MKTSKLVRSALLLLALSVRAGAYAQTLPASDTQTKAAPQPVIDMHMHTRSGPYLVNGKPAAPGGLPEPVIRAEPLFTDGPAILRGTLEAMDQYNIVLGFLSGPEQILSRWVEAGGGRFLSSPTINAVGGKIMPTVEHLRTLLEAKRYTGLGEIATQYQGVAPNDPRMEPYFALAEEFDLPVLIHTLGIGAPTATFRSAMGRPLLLEDVVVRHPKLRIYLENAGYPYLDEVIALMTQYPNVYGDLSTITWLIPRTAFHRYLRGLVEAGLGKRLMFGSDQMNWPEAIGWAIASVESAEFLTPEQKRDIFYNNAARFLRLSELEILRHHGTSSTNSQ